MNGTQQTTAACESCDKASTTLKPDAAEIHEEELLFKTPPPRDACPICFLPMPFSDNDMEYMQCCGKDICHGCVIGHFIHTAGGKKTFRCPFCRSPPTFSDVGLQMIKNRVAKNDPESLYQLGRRYFSGQNGVQQDYEKSLEMLTKAADLGSVRAHLFLGMVYYNGRGTTKDLHKGMHHLKIAAMKGDNTARHVLGFYEMGERKDHERAYRHFIIAAKDGFKDSMRVVRLGYKKGHVTKQEFKETYRAHKQSLDEMKSEQRDKASSLST